MINNLILYAIISLVIIFMGHSVFKYFTDLYTEEITKDLHTQTNAILNDITEDVSGLSSPSDNSSREIPKNNVEESKNDELEEFMNSLDDVSENVEPQSNLPDQLLEFNSNDMNSYTEYSL